MNRFLGYVVVRQPSSVGEAWGDRLRLVVTDDGRSLVYRGVDRDPWWGLDEAFYNGMLPDDLADLREIVIGNRIKSFSPGMCPSVSDAEHILRFCNSRNFVSEIIAISDSPPFAKITDGAGYDYYVDGYGSLVRLGFFERPDVFSDFSGYLNENGLFNFDEDLMRYKEAYVQRCRSANLEPVQPAGLVGFSLFVSKFI